LRQNHPNEDKLHIFFFRKRNLFADDMRNLRCFARPLWVYLYQTKRQEGRQRVNKDKEKQNIEQFFFTFGYHTISILVTYLSTTE